VPPIAGRYYLHDRLFEYDRSGLFFPGIGKNDLFIYLLSEVAAILLRATHLYKWIFDHLFRFPGLYAGSLLFCRLVHANVLANKLHVKQAKNLYQGLAQPSIKTRIHAN
jgi:hypothetical protein